jgi:hypothetical protein
MTGWGIRSRGTGESDRSNDVRSLGPLSTPYVVTTLSCGYYFVPQRTGSLPHPSAKGISICLSLKAL